MLVLILGLFAVATSSVVVTPCPYEEWAGSYRLSNGVVDLVVVPKIGRIMRFGFVGKQNLLWESQRVDGEPPKTGTWKNWGGDKVWPAPEDTWGWPPEPEYDGSEWDARPLQDGVQMVSRTKSEKLGLRMERTIRLSKNRPEAIIENKLINDSGAPVQFAVWEVCQVDNPEACVLPIWKSSQHPQGWRVYGKDIVDHLVTEKGKKLFVRRDPKRGIKYGSGSPEGYVSAKIRGETITLKTPYVNGLTYPDQGDAQEIFTAADPLDYCELEITGPVEKIEPGRAISIQVTISLSKD